MDKRASNPVPFQCLLMFRLRREDQQWSRSRRRAFTGSTSVVGNLRHVLVADAEQER
jgi:hypothetical protein